MEKVFFATYGGGHINIILPIVKEIQRQNIFECAVIGLTSSIGKLKAEGIAHKSLYDYIDYFADKESILEIGNGLAKKYHNSGIPGMEYRDTVAYMGFSMYDLINSIGYDKAWSEFEMKGRSAFNPLNTFEKILEIEKPDVIVATCTQRAEKAAVLAGNKLNIKTVFIHDLIELTENISSAKYHFVMCEYTMEKLRLRGIPQKNIFITGQPAFDSIYSIELMDETKILSDLSISIGERIILYISQNMGSVTEQVLNEVLSEYKKLSGFRLIIKLHPNEYNESIYTDLVRKHNLQDEVITIKNYDIQKLIKVSDIAITQDSTAGLETILMDKPLIVVNLSGIPYPLRYEETGAAIGVFEPGILAFAIESAIFNQTTIDNLRVARRKVKLPEKGSNLVCNAIKSILQIEQ